MAGIVSKNKMYSLASVMAVGLSVVFMFCSNTFASDSVQHPNRRVLASLFFPKVRQVELTADPSGQFLLVPPEVFVPKRLLPQRLPSLSLPICHLERVLGPLSGRSISFPIIDDGVFDAVIDLGLVNRLFVMSVIAVDFANSHNSPTRQALFELLPETLGSGWKDQYLENLLGSPLPAARLLHTHLTNPFHDREYHQKNIAEFLKKLADRMLQSGQTELIYNYLQMTQEPYQLRQYLTEDAILVPFQLRALYGGCALHLHQKP